MQIAIMDSKNINWRTYHEIVIYFVPYCDSVWCGFDYETIKRNNITPWTCLPIR